MTFRTLIGFALPYRGRLAFCVLLMMGETIAALCVPWLGGSCGHCWYCRHDKENLCDAARYTGYQINGGFAEYTVADAAYCFELPPRYDDLQAAPLL